MTPLEDLERRIATAFDRIVQAAENTAPAVEAPDNSEELISLRQALEEERTANAQLEERVRSIREKQETQVVALQAQVDEQKAALAALDAEMQALRSAAQQLRDNNQALREANAAGLTEPDLINQALQLESDTLRAERSMERAELDTLLGQLEPLLSEGAATLEEGA